MKQEEIRRLLAEQDGAAQLEAHRDEALDGLISLWRAGNFNGGRDCSKDDAALSARALGLIAAWAGKKAVREKLLSKESAALVKEQLGFSLRNVNYKMRKNAARLAGALGLPELAPAVEAALTAEDTALVRPSQLLALGAIGGEEAHRFLAEYRLPEAVTENEKVHNREAEEALRKALLNTAVREKHRFIGLSGETELILTAPDNLTEFVARELERQGIPVLKKTPSGVTVRVSSLDELSAIRGYKEILFPMKREDIVPFLKATHSGEPPFAFRWELRGYRAESDKNRAALAKELNEALRKLPDGDALINSPSDYEAELRLSGTEKKNNLALKLFTADDTRFEYRKKTIPASIQPSVAAALAEWLRGEKTADNPRVLDPCCGSGTLLWERVLAGPCASLTGLDIAREALAGASENAKALVGQLKADGKALPKITLKQTDMLAYTPDEPFDEIVANLPFGNRVGSHSGNEKLYAGLVSKLPEWLKPNGRALLYTTEVKLMAELLAKEPRLSVVKTLRTEAGGLKPGMFMVKRAER